jgi:hypothetical protein
LTKILVPRSDSVSAKVIEPSDFEKMFSQDFIRDYIVSGFTVSSATGLSVNITLGEARLKGLHIESTATENVASLTANTSNYIYITLSRDGNSEAQSWDFSKNTSGTIPTDSILLAKVTTNGSSVTGVDISERVTTHQNLNFDDFWFGDGSDGDVTVSSSTTFNTPKDYNNLTINASQTLSYNGANQTNAIIRVKGTLTVNGILSATGKGRAGGAGGATQTTNSGGGFTGTVGLQSWGADLTSGNSGAGGNGGTGHVAGGVGGGAAGISGVSGDLRIVADTRFNDANEILRAQPQIYGAGGSGGGGGSGGVGTSGYSSGGDGGAGGSGGNGGGTLLVFAKNITIASGGIIESNGAAGGNGAAGTIGNGSSSADAGGGGGGGSGGGGSGGFVGVVYKSLTNNGNINANGGATGTAGAGGAAEAGGNGAAGTAGSTGTAGGSGMSKVYQI